MRLTLLFAIAIMVPFLSINSSKAATPQTKARLLTPFSKRPVDENGIKQRNIPAEGYLKTGLVVSYGFRPTSSNSWFGDTYLYSDYSATERYYYPINHTLGQFEFRVAYDIRQWLELDVAFGYSRNNGREVDSYKQGVRKDADDIFSLMPSLKINWMRWGHWVSVYSRAGIGCALANRNYSEYQHMVARFAPVWQLSPIGVEFGYSKITAFVEYGFGQSGMLSFGFKFKVRNKKSEVPWYQYL